MNARNQIRAHGASRSFSAVLALIAIAGAACSSSGDDKSSDGVITGDGTTMQPMNGATGANNNPGTGMNPIGGNTGNNGGTTGQEPDSQNAGGTMPCDVSTVVKTSCQTCHGATPLGGAPMSLLTVADFTRDYVAKTTKPLMGQSFKMYDLARIRINAEMGTTPMPQGTELAADAKATLNNWLAAMAPAGAACTGTQMKPPVKENPMGMAGSGGVDDGSGDGPISMATTSQCDLPGSRDHLTEKNGETCYDFQVHGISGAQDTSKFTIPLDESYNQFYYAVPWPAGSVATRYGGDYDNLPVLHHWLAFSSISANPPGTVTPNVTGTTLGENAELIAGWAIGGCNTDYGDDVGVMLPSDGDIMIQWHHFNSTGTPQQDGSKVRICTVPMSARKNIAGITFLGTEAIALAPGENSLGSTCTNNTDGPITILGFTPHMHTIGSRMTSVVTRAGSGKTEMVFDKAFVFDQQVNYKQDPLLVLNPGDTIESTCTWQNDTGGIVTFGQSTHDEMCYQFTLSYPYGALNNGVISLIGATNTCW
jgi:hypothetical protein